MLLSAFQNNLVRLCNEVYREIGGYGPENFYQEALLHELDLLYKNQYDVYKEDSTPLIYKGFEMSSRRLDITIYPKNNDVTPLIILELKWIDTELEPWQLSNYMKIRNCKYGFMINFEKLGTHPTNYCAQIYDVNSNQQLIFPIPEQRQGLVKILRFENNQAPTVQIQVSTEQKCLGCGIVIPTNSDKPRCYSCFKKTQR